MFDFGERIGAGWFLDDMLLLFFAATADLLLEADFVVGLDEDEDGMFDVADTVAPALLPIFQ